MKTHTPGPWTIVDNGDDTEYGAFSIASCSEDACFAPIADFKLAESGCMEPDGNGGSQEFAHYSVGRDECLANARLCAAAPELLECARMLALVTAEGGFSNDRDRVDLHKKSRSAINKALKGDGR